jgi:thioesterase domain-containing protein
VPVQTSGTRAPLFFVHGVGGVMPLGSSFKRALGSEQPLYAIHANGIDGKQPALDDVRQMVLAYVEEIRSVRPAGPIRIGGMCAGCLIAMEVASRVQQEHRVTGPVILMDPPSAPYGYQNRRVAWDFGNPKVAELLYQHARRELIKHASRGDNDMPFDTHDPKQMHVATLVAVRTVSAFSRHIPSPFPRPAELIISAERAAQFFHPQMPWQKLLPGPRVVHVLPRQHWELFREGRESVCQLLKFMLSEASAPEGDPKRPQDFAIGITDASGSSAPTERPIV